MEENIIILLTMFVIKLIDFELSDIFQNIVIYDHSCSMVGRKEVAHSLVEIS
jgi:hypothetical protein